MDRRSSTLYPREDSRLFRSSNFVGVVANENQEVVNLTEQPPDVVRLLKPHIGNNRNMLTVADMIRIVLLYGRKEKKNEKLKKVIEKLERSLRKLKYLLLVAVLLILGLTSGLAFVIVYKVGNKIDDTKDTVLSRSGVMMMKEESVEVSTKSHGIIVGDDGGFVDSDGKEIICMSSEKVQQLFVANAEGTPTKIVSSVGTGLNVRSLDVPGSNSEWNNRFTQIGNIKFVPNLECINIVNENNSDGIIRNEANRGGNDTILDGAGRSLTEEHLLYHHQKLQEIVTKAIILRGQEPKTKMNSEQRKLENTDGDIAYNMNWFPSGDISSSLWGSMNSENESSESNTNSEDESMESTTFEPTSLFEQTEEICDSRCRLDGNSGVPFRADTTWQQFKSAVYAWNDNSVSSAYGKVINCWNTMAVTDMFQAFITLHDFNEPINCWNTARVTRMEYMFADARAFNQDLSRWDVSRVTNIDYMFSSAHNFYQDLSRWDVSRVRTFNPAGFRDLFQLLTNSDRMCYYSVTCESSL